MEGDHIIIAPPYDVDAAEVDDIINKVVDLINTFFAEYMPATP
jgi:adenosylmethionine-8-amino-7-oxononanoate aminotransferase